MRAFENFYTVHNFAGSLLYSIAVARQEKTKEEVMLMVALKTMFDEKF
jgi:hypothetical protein